MPKTFAIILALVFSTYAYATPDYARYFKNQSGCFILYDVQHSKIINEYKPTRCAERIAPDSTFKIALSLMAFDQHLITQNTIFKWDGQDKGWTVWNQNQTPYTWLKNSVVWVSRVITPQLGMAKIEEYLAKFHYGNRDFSGDPGKNNGLTNAWLSSSLKISANEQLNFLKKLVLDQLPVSQEAMFNTKTNMYLETSPKGWKLYGKTGTGARQQEVVNNKLYPEDGWFEGFIQKGRQTYIFVLNFSDLQTPTREAGGTRAKEKVKAILTQHGFF
jgi:beta-lactamase class D/beta-lactamase class D OXA-1